jgi:putative phage-type endonuclease
MDVIHEKRVRELLTLGGNHEQGSDEWFTIRHSMITASDVCTAIGEDPYSSREDLLLKKCKNPNTGTFSGNKYTEWGKLFEPVATDLFSKRRNVTVHQTGCIRHKWDSHIGASPDGILDDGTLLEIKCPFSRIITSHIPMAYWVQMQIQMEVCCLDKCVFLQCKFHKYKNYKEYNEYHGYKETRYGIAPTHDVTNDTHGYIKDHDCYWRIDVYQEHIVERDTEWYKGVRNELMDFWSKVEYYRKVGVDSIPTNIWAAENNSNTWVSQKDIRNYVVDDVFLDIVSSNHITYHTHMDQPSTFIELVAKRNKSMKDDIISIWKKVFTVKCIMEHPGTYKYSNVVPCIKYKTTIQAMKLGYKIIQNAVLHNTHNHTFGVADMIVRSDILQSMFSNELQVVNCNPDKCVGTQLDTPFHYVILSVNDIKLPLSCDGVHVRNTPTTKVKKCELYILNEALGCMQGYTQPSCYMMSSRWSYTHKTIEYTGNSCFDRLGVIDFSDRDESLVGIVQDAITWVRELRSKDTTYNISKPNYEACYPNMCQTSDYPYHSLKSSTAKTNGEITSVWCCNTKHRRNAIENGVYSWTDPLCNVDTMGVEGVYYRERVQGILDINHQETDIIRRLTNVDPVHDDIIHIRGVRDYYFDFETTTIHSRTILGNNSITTETTLIAMIGCGWANEQGEWEFRSFVVDSLSISGERTMMQSFYDFLSSMGESKSQRFVHWGHAEKTNLRDVLKRHSNHTWHMLELFDMCSYFKKYIVVVKGALTYGLKNIVSALHKNGVIKHVWDHESDCTSGMDAMVQFLQIRDEVMEQHIPFSEHDMMGVIRSYNEIDCRVLYDILSYIRTEFN